MKFLKFKNIFNYKNLYWFYILLLSLVFIFFVPPFQKPDAEFHYYNAFSSIHNGCISDNNGGYMLIPKDVYNFPQKLQSLKISSSYQIKFPRSLLKDRYISSSSQNVIYDRPCVKFPILSYFPNIIGLKIGGNNLLVGFYLSRVFGFLFFLAILFISIKFVGRYYPLVIAFSIIPMVIHQVTAISYDSFHISLGLLSFSFYIYLKNNFSRVKPYLLFLFYVLLLAFVLIKGGYYLLLVLPILLPAYPFFTKKIKNIIIKFLILIIYFLLSLFLIKSSVGYIDNTSKSLIDIFLQKKVILGDPFYFIQVLNNTFYKNFYFYWISFLDNFGALDYQPHFSISLFITIIVLYIISKVKFTGNKINKFSINNILEVVFIFGIAIGSYIIIQTAEYLTWSPVASKTIEGVQGRYLFIPFLFIIYGLVRLIEIIGTKKIKKVFFIIIVLMISINIIKSVYLRYYDYSGVYADINDLNFDGYKDYKKNSSEYKSISVNNNKLCENIGDNKVGGFAVYFTNNLKENEYIRDVFKYEVLSGDKILHSGYLDQVRIQSEGRYLEEFKKILNYQKGNDLCIRLYKKYPQQNSNSILYFVEKDGISVRFLKISK